MKKWIILIIILLLLGGVTAYRIQAMVGLKLAESIAKIQEQSGVPVRVYTAQRKNLQKTITVSGSITPRKIIKISPTITERISKIHVTTGQQVSSGKLLVTLDDTKGKITVAQAEAAVLEAREHLTKLMNGSRPEEIDIARARWEEAQAYHKLQKLELERQQGLYSDGASTLQQLQDAESRFSTATATLAAAQSQYQLTQKGPRQEDIKIAQAAVKLAQANLDQARKNLRDHYLKAPGPGLTTHNLFEPGDILEMNKPVFSLVDISSVYLDINVSELYLPAISIGMQVEVAVDSLPGRNFTGTVSEINPVANLAERSYLTRILIENKDHTLRADMFARAKIIIEKINQALVVPLDAVKKQGEKNYVLVARGRTTPASAPLSIYDIQEPRQWITQLGNQKNLLSVYLVSKLREKTRRALQGHPAETPPSEKLLTAIIEDINSLITTECIYEKNRFHSIELAISDPNFTGVELENISNHLNQPTKTDSLKKPIKKLYEQLQFDLKPADFSTSKQQRQLAALNEELTALLEMERERKKKIIILNRMLLEKVYPGHISSGMHAHKVNVTLGKTFGNLVQITDGLTIGTKVITLSTGVEPGSRVNLAE